MAKVKRAESGCQEWQAALDRVGYGKFAFRGKTSVKAHRVAYQLFAGPIPDGAQVLHRCDNRRCVNIDHLFLGSAADNVADMDAKGRRGTKSRLTPDDASAIRHLLKSKVSQAVIAEKFGLDQTTISRIKLHRTLI